MLNNENFMRSINTSATVHLKHSAGDTDIALGENVVYG